MSAPKPKHIYIIHTRADAEAVKRLITELRHQDIQIWVDDTGLKVGTHDWEQTLRDVIHNAYAVLLVASPHVRRFPYLRDEVALATMENIPVYPLWLAGNVWRDCVPTGYDYSRFIDIRDAAYEVGVEQIRRALEGKPIQLQTQEFAAISDDSDVSDEDTSPPLEPDAVRRNPYTGLHAFTAANSRDFFGRGAVLQELIDDVRDGIATLPFLCLVGASGSGKSSLLHAGLLPILREGEISGSGDWLYADTFSPSTQPMTHLARVLQPFLSQTPLENILETLNHPSSGGLHRLAEQIVNLPHQRLVLVVDSLEGLFTLTQSDDERQQFMDVVTTAIEIPDSRVLILAALDAEYYDRPLQYGHFGRLLGERHRAILPFSLTEVYRGIHRPAQLSDAQVRFESGLVAELAFALRGDRDALPLMQMTLTQLFYRRYGDKLTWAAYEVIGGIYRVIDVLAERTMSQLPTDSHRKAARTLFLGLIHLGVSEADTMPQTAKRSDLTSPTGVLEETATAFLNTGLLVNETQADETVIRITHPIVLRRWERLHIG
ncbi:MAG: TIR domain-containing protein [Anaerolineae bacterium]|nr:TIR domain-containing protein [Anaerolineae bacterium]